MTREVKSWRDAQSASDVLSAHADSLKTLISDLDLEAVQAAGELLDQACLQGNTVYSAGNGGSAATASHITADLSWGRRMEGEARPRAVSLVSNSPLMTALANDSGYAEVFVEQLKSGFKEGDILIAISASGNSENVLRAVQYVNDNGGSTIGLVGFDGGRLKAGCRLCVHVPTPVGAYELVEDIHHAVCHMLASYLKYKAANRSSGSGLGVR